MPPWSPGSCDGILMVVRSNVTPSDLARRAREEFPDKLLLGVVLNGTSTGRAGTRSKYYYGEAVSTAKPRSDELNRGQVDPALQCLLPDPNTLVLLIGEALIVWTSFLLGAWVTLRDRQLPGAQL